MRLIPWLGGLVAVALVVTGVVAVTHRAAPTRTQALTAVRSQQLFGVQGGAGDPPHVIPPAAPSPAATSRPPATSSAVAPARASRPSIVVRTTQQALINRDRAQSGLAPLTWSACLYNVALANARRIASQGYLSHTSGPQTDLSCGLGNRAGENIGEWSNGINDVQINALFMASPEHRANILGPYHYVATAWVVEGGKGWIAVEFG